MFERNYGRELQNIKLTQTQAKKTLNTKKQTISLQIQTEIFINLLEKSRYQILNFSKFNGCKETKIRAIQIDFIIQTHKEENLKQQTLFLAINILDKFIYMKTKTYSQNQIQLIAITCLFISCKFEEIYTRDLAIYLGKLNNFHQEEEYYEMEAEILLTIQYDINIPTSLNFLELLISEQNLTNKNQIKFMNYLLEIQYMEQSMQKYSELTKAVVAYCFIKSQRCQLQSIYAKYFDNTQIRQCMDDLKFVYENQNQLQSTSIQSKYQKFLKF